MKKPNKERTVEEAYDDLVSQGAYEEANPDADEIEKIKKTTVEDYEYGQKLKTGDQPNWRVIFNIQYDALRELCGLLMRFKKQKTSNHQGLFAFIILQFPELNFDWAFFETIRTMRNHNKYLGTDITKEKWQKIEFQTMLYISTLKKEIERLIKTAEY
jgi:hypothetical protein